jgi:LPS export ABC transporter permease LptF
MSQIERYIFRIALGAFFACLIGLTGTIWVTQALRELDLITAKGQTLVIFFLITGLSLPTLITVIAPVALFIAVVHTLNKLNGDSELIVMSAAGMRPRQILRPFLSLGLAVSLAVGFLTIQVMPSSFQELRDVLTRVRGDFIANVVKEGQFTSLDSGITFHFRERGPGGSLLGLFIQDKREPGKSVVYLAERGQAVEYGGQSYLALEKGSVHRQQKDSRDASIITFERYTVDLAAFTPPDAELVYKPRERAVPRHERDLLQAAEGPLPGGTARSPLVLALPPRPHLHRLCRTRRPAHDPAGARRSGGGRGACRGDRKDRRFRGLQRRRAQRGGRGRGLRGATSRHPDLGRHDLQRRGAAGLECARGPCVRRTFRPAPPAWRAVRRADAC